MNFSQKPFSCGASRAGNGTIGHPKARYSNTQSGPGPSFHPCKTGETTSYNYCGMSQACAASPAARRAFEALMFPAMRRDKDKRQVPMRPRNFLQDTMKPLAVELSIDPSLITF